MTQVLWILLAALAAYLIGSISSAIIVGKIVSGEDIRSHGSGNAGATNALRTYGKKVAVVVLLCDVAKGMLSAVPAYFLAKYLQADEALWQRMLYASFIGAVLGHNFPVYFRFHGGKGVLVSTVAMFFTDWRIALIVTIFALLVMIVTRYVSLGSVLGAVAFFVCALIFRWGDTLFIVYALMLSALVVYMHRSNIVRLLNGTESKVGQKKA